MPTELTAVGERLFFSANDGRSGRELWQSDGTSEGTRLVKDIWPGSSSAVPQQLSNVNGNLVFSASDGQSGVEAWRSDGTAAGTIRIYDIAPGPANANPTQFIFAGDQMFFTANDGAAGQELWSLRSFITKVATTGGELFSWLDHTTYEFPNGTFTTPVTVTHSLRTPIQSADSYPLLPLGYAFKLTVVDSTTALPVQPERPYRLTVQYTDAELGVVIESTLALHGWDGQQWVKEPSSIVEAATHRIIATPTHTAQWVVLGNTYRLLLPVIIK